MVEAQEVGVESECGGFYCWRVDVGRWDSKEQYLGSRHRWGDKQYEYGQWSDDGEGQEWRGYHDFDFAQWSKVYYDCGRLQGG